MHVIDALQQGQVTNADQQIESNGQSGVQNQYNEKVIRDTIPYAIYEAEVEFDAEMDFLIALPQFKVLGNVQ